MSYKKSISTALFVVALVLGTAHAEAISTAAQVPQPSVSVDLLIDGSDASVNAGSHFLIWTSQNADYVNITIGNGAYIEEFDNLPVLGGGSYYLPEPVNGYGGFVQIEAVSAANGYAYDSISINPAPITVTSPNGASYWQDGSTETVTFDFPRYDADVFRAHLENSYFPGMKYPLTFADIAKTSRSFNVTAPALLIQQLINDRPAGSGEWDIRTSFYVVVTGISITGNGNQVVSESYSQEFQIDPANTTLGIQYPADAATIEVGAQFPIVWKMSGTADVGISFIGSTVGSVPVIVSNTGSYVATAPSTPGTYTVELDEEAKGGGATASVQITVVAKPVVQPSAPDELEVIVRRSTTAAGRPTVIFVPKSLPQDYGFALKMQSGNGVGTLKAADLIKIKK